MESRIQKEIKCIWSKILELTRGQGINTKKIEENNSSINELETNIEENKTSINELETKTNFVDDVNTEALSYLNDLNTIENFEINDSLNWLQISNDLKNKVYYYIRYHEPSIFINLIMSVLFRLVISESKEIGRAHV